MQTINCTPKWRDVLPILLACLRSENLDSIKAAEEELNKMAAIADKFVEMQKKIGWLVEKSAYYKTWTQSFLFSAKLTPKIK